MSSFCRSLVLATTVALTSPVVQADDSAGSTPDIEHGRATFNTMCSVCHSVKASGGPVEGPNLLGLVGRPAGSHPAFARYSEALKSSGIVWSTEALDRFLTNPMAMVPGTLMPMLIPDDRTRANVVAYLETLKE